MPIPPAVDIGSSAVRGSPCHDFAGARNLENLHELRVLAQESISGIFI
jgi:hypothetical protein